MNDILYSLPQRRIFTSHDYLLPRPNWLVRANLFTWSKWTRWPAWPGQASYSDQVNRLARTSQLLGPGEQIGPDKPVNPANRTGPEQSVRLAFPGQSVHLVHSGPFHPAILRPVQSVRFVWSGSWDTPDLYRPILWTRSSQLLDSKRSMLFKKSV